MAALLKLERWAEQQTLGSPLSAKSIGEDPPTHTPQDRSTSARWWKYSIDVTCVDEGRLLGLSPFMFPFSFSTRMKGKPRQAKQTRVGFSGSVKQRGDRGTDGDSSVRKVSQPLPRGLMKTQSSGSTVPRGPRLRRLRCHWTLTFPNRRLEFLCYPDSYLTLQYKWLPDTENSQTRGHQPHVGIQSCPLANEPGLGDFGIRSNASSAT